MGASFNKIIPLIKKIEGDKTVDSPSDLGGLTKYGISQNANPDIDVANLSEEQAMEFLETKFWNKYHLFQIMNQGIANQLFFMLINMDPIQAIKLVQIAINACGGLIIKVDVDGILGEKTFNAINSLVAGWFSNRIRLEAIGYYLHITDINKSQIPNFRGWVRRALTQ